jgi:hypothetical protein
MRQTKMFFITHVNLSNSIRGSPEEGTPGTVTKHVSTTTSTEKVKTNLNVMIDDCDQPNPTTPNDNAKTTLTKSTIGWSIVSFVYLGVSVRARTRTVFCVTYVTHGSVTV